jgi:XTP/dITP diphosphohydrolase
VVASGNAGKLSEIRATLDFAGWTFVAAGELGVWPDVPETGASFLDNALIKARAALELFGMTALADDSGLEVDALGDRPGVRSSRWAGETATDADNNRKLLAELVGVAEERRTARFRSVIVLIAPDGSFRCGEGTCEGSIATRPAGVGGFGYDPLFMPEATPGLSMAQLSMSEKNAISHRGAALRALRAGIISGRG